MTKKKKIPKTNFHSYIENSISNFYPVFLNHSTCKEVSIKASKSALTKTRKKTKKKMDIETYLTSYGQYYLPDSNLLRIHVSMY